MLEERKTKYHKIIVLEHENLGKTILLNNDIMSTENNSDYDKAIMSLMPRNAKNVLILGGGDLSLAHEIQKMKSVKSIVIVEVDSEVPVICRKYFEKKSQIGKKCRLVIMDAFEYIKHPTIKPDVVIDDMYRQPINSGKNYYKSLAKAFPDIYIISQTDTKNYIYFDKIQKKIREFAKDIKVKETSIKAFLEPWTFTRYKFNDN